MNIHDALRLLAGCVVLAGVALTYLVHHGWCLLVLFAALNLIQSAFTKWCPAMWVFKKLGLR